MNALVFLLLALAISFAGIAFILLRQRRPTSVESGVDEFAREMRALSPEYRHQREQQRRRGGGDTPPSGGRPPQPPPPEED